MEVLPNPSAHTDCGIKSEYVRLIKITIDLNKNIPCKETLMWDGKKEISINDIYYLIENTDYKGTYKCVFLIALVLVIEERNNKDELKVSYIDITKKMIEIYWPFTTSVESDSETPKLLSQYSNESQQLVLISKLAKLREDYFLDDPKQIYQYLSNSSFDSLVSKIRDNPVARLQPRDESPLYTYDESQLVIRSRVAPLLSKHSKDIISKCVQKWNDLLQIYNPSYSPKELSARFDSVLDIKEYSSSPDLDIKPFEPLSETGAIEKRRKQFYRTDRPGQKKFRDKMFRIYSSKCCITGIDTPEVLQAAHIEPYKNVGSHHSQNGMLLSAEMHLLFDSGLITIVQEDADTYKVFVNLGRTSDRFHQYHDKIITNIPRNKLERPSAKALRLQNALFERLNKIASPSYKKSKKKQDAYISLINPEDTKTNNAS